MVQPLRSLATLQENSSWVPNMHAVTITPTVTVKYRFRGSICLPLLVLAGTQTSMMSACLPTQANLFKVLLVQSDFSKHYLYSNCCAIWAD